MGVDLLFGLMPEHLLLALILVLMILEISRADRRLAGVLFPAAVMLGCLVLLRQITTGYHAEIVVGEISVDRFALLSRLVLLVCGLILGLSFQEPLCSFKARMLLASSLLGGLVMMSSTGFLSLFIGIEMLSLPAFALMVHGCGDTGASEGSFKYLLLSSVASALVLFGASLGYEMTGSLSLAAFDSSLRAGGALAFAAGGLVLAGLCIKAALFPFHGWAPDAYSAAQLPVTAFLASLVKGAVLLAAARLFPSLGCDPGSATLLSVLCVVSICYGNIAAIRQTGFKRVLAYSSIAHAGYLLFALVGSDGQAAENLLYYVAVYAVTTIVACACFAQLAEAGTDDLAALEGAFHARPVPAFTLALTLLSLAGIPPLPGFLAKLFVFRSVVASGGLGFAVLAFGASLLGVVYYLRVVFLLFQPRPSERGIPETGINIWNRGGVLVGALVLALYLVCPDCLTVRPAGYRAAGTGAGTGMAWMVGEKLPITLGVR